MKTAVIDIGSNSVRLAMIADGKTLYKRLSTTRLGEGLIDTGIISPLPMERTARAVADFYFASLKEADKVYAFATAAVRSAKNGGEFVAKVKDMCGLTVQILSGEEEAKCGILGALKGCEGGIIDVGGASSEVAVWSKGSMLFSQSVNVGTVVIHDAAGRDRQKLERVISDKISAYKPFNGKPFSFRAIGGTASRLASVKHKLLEYHPEITDGTRLSLKDIAGLTDMLLTMPVEEIRATTICGSSADIVGGGALLIYEIMRRFGIDEITVSESDNLEGFLILTEGKA